MRELHHAPAARGTLGRGEPPQTPARVEHVEAVRVALEIGPVGVRRVDEQRLAPHQRLTARADHRPDARCIRAVRIGAHIFDVGRQIVDLDRVSVSIFRPNLLNRTRRRTAAHHGRADLSLRRLDQSLGGAGRRRRRLTRYQHRNLLKLRDLPRGLRALGRLVGAQANAREHRIDVEAGLAHHLGDGHRIGAIGSLPVRRDRAGRGRKRDEEIGSRFDGSKTGCDPSALDLERQGTRRVEDHDLGRCRCIRERTQQIEQPHALNRDLAVAIELRVDRDQVVVALELNRIARVVDERDRVGPRSVHLGEEFPEQPAKVA